MRVNNTLRFKNILCAASVFLWPWTTPPRDTFGRQSCSPSHTADKNRSANLAAADKLDCKWHVRYCCKMYKWHNLTNVHHHRWSLVPCILAHTIARHRASEPAHERLQLVMFISSPKKVYLLESTAPLLGTASLEQCPDRDRLWNCLDDQPAGPMDTVAFCRSVWTASIVRCFVICANLRAVGTKRKF